MAVVLAGLAATAAQAQSAYRGQLTLPYEVRWGLAVLPPGDYTLAMRGVDEPMSVIDAGGRTRAFVYGSREVPRPAQPASLLVSRDGAQRTVRALNCPAWGVNMVYKPFTRAERNLVASGDQVERLPVRLASR
jgi:hypothetical protein